MGGFRITGYLTAARRKDLDSYVPATKEKKRAAVGKGWVASHQKLANPWL